MLLACPRDLFIAGKIVHFLDDKFYRVSVHDVSEAIFTIPTMIDHTGYYSMYQYINEQLLKPRAGAPSEQGAGEFVASGDGDAV